VEIFFSKIKWFTTKVDFLRFGALSFIDAEDAQHDLEAGERGLAHSQRGIVAPDSRDNVQG
jgi:hypothetical protein